METKEFSHLEKLEDIAMSDVEGLKVAEAQYGASWKKRGGVGAFMMLARKWDRLEKACKEKGWDIFNCLQSDERPEGIIDDIRDLRRYLFLVESEALGQNMKSALSTHRDNATF